LFEQPFNYNKFYEKRSKLQILIETANIVWKPNGTIRCIRVSIAEGAAVAWAQALIHC
jgi:hypothetical protein